MFPPLASVGRKNDRSSVVLRDQLPPRHPSRFVRFLPDDAARNEFMTVIALKKLLNEKSTHIIHDNFPYGSALGTFLA